MAVSNFRKAIRPVPTSLGPLTITLTDSPQAGTPSGMKASFAFTVLDASEQRIDSFTGKLDDYLTAAQLTALTNLFSAIKTKAAETLT